MKKLSICLIALTLSCLLSHAQVTGRVIDSKTREVIDYSMSIMTVRT